MSDLRATLTGEEREYYDEIMNGEAPLYIGENGEPVFVTAADQRESKLRAALQWLYGDKGGS